MGFSKALDKVRHTKPVDQLHYYGILGKTNSWIKACLTDRFPREVPVTSGVPQGSVLGPCLFHFYTNDIPDNITSTVRLIADDIIMYIALKPKTNTAALQEDLHKVDKWAKKTGA